ncbi:PTS sugar transporter subunit IIC [Vagococcus fluvialis]|uniref:Permease IIC component n=1 Tax=Vagococcus fluvialis TaxID=2738 RepID=A0A7X6D9H5_9ENTE|nr:PTS transporter subunit EIIC [Vagococcus fluvialis]NKC68240.1 PTS sugar transporter subunit IIC [Vagococcus fluvialis]
MKEKFSKLGNILIEKVMKFANTKSIIALRDGFMLTMPITLAGSIFMLIGNFPVPNWQETVSKYLGENWNIGLSQVTGSTFDILAIVAVLGISYVYLKNEDLDAISGALISLIAFLIITSSTVSTESGEVIKGVIPKAWVNGNGVIAAIIVGLIAPKIFAFFIRKKIIFKMPDSVPTGVSNAFAALIPGVVIFFLAMIVYQTCMIFGGISFTEVIFKVLQTPLQSLTGSLPGGIIIITLMSLLFWVGVHGPNVVNGIVSALLMANATSNQTIIDSGQALIAGENASIITKQVTENFAKFGGTGITLGLIIAVLLAGKSKQFKTISKMSLVPGMFNINEPIIFGLPIVFNPIMFIPFILIPLFALLITYFSILLGFLQPFGNLFIPWATPPIISGFLLGGWQGAVVQLVILLMSIAMYYPFMKLQDNMFLKQENSEI